ncbi:class I SAM-dependent methyltransferase [Streptomyces sp. NPDC048644]|uniref:class I SAM-dependent methyltransferase n=1 Tax=Streptomyces sp. NPDC048644 TaxID=3365582 RepID=UPI00371E8D59
MCDDTPYESRRVHLSRTFDEDAELYDRARPGYPPELFDDLAEVVGTGPGCRVLEVGAGTRKATLPLAERGCRITAVELGAGMAAVARRNLAGFGAVEVVTADFEAWQHVAGGSEEFFVEVQDCYERFDPATAPGLRLPVAKDVDTSDHADEVAHSGRFSPVVFRRYEWDLMYTTSEYLEVLRTYSGHRALPPEAREGLLGCIARLIDERYGGRVTKRYLTELRVSRTVPLCR